MKRSIFLFLKIKLFCPFYLYRLIYMEVIKKMG
jgi:hypothetical protein